jgi:hypothetical protein
MDAATPAEEEERNVEAGGWASRPCICTRRGGGRDKWWSEGGRALGGAAYTCKDRVEGNSGGWQVAGSPFAGKDRYEFEKFFAPRTVLTLSESVFRYIDTRQRIPV